MCQCPLGLMTHFYEDTKMEEERNELVSMPSRADDSFLLDDAGKIKPIIIHVSMPSRADDSFLRDTSRYLS